MDKQKVLKAITSEWQNTKNIAIKVKSGNQNIISTLYELFVDDKLIDRKIMPYGKDKKTIYWRLK